MAKWQCDHCGKIEENEFQTKMPDRWQVIRIDVREQTDKKTDIRFAESCKIRGQNRICGDCAKKSMQSVLEDGSLTVKWKLKTYEEMFEKQKSKKEVTTQKIIMNDDGLGAFKI